MDNHRILIIDDDPEIQSAYRMVLALEDQQGRTANALLAELVSSSQGAAADDTPRFDLDFAAQGSEGVAMAESAHNNSHPFAAAFIDIRMPPGYDGMETAARIRKIDPDVEIVIVTAYSDRSREEIVRAVGVPDKLLFLRKPFDPEELIQLALSLTTKWNLARQAEARKDHLETVLKTTPAAIFTVDKDRCITSWNPAAEQITGYPATDVVGRPCIMDKIGAEKICHDCPLDCTDAVDLQEEVQIIDSNGVPRTLLKNATCIKNRQGRIIRVVESFWDITARKAAEAAQSASEARFRALVETTSDWVWETDKQGHFIYCSPLCESIYGYAPEELIGRSFFERLLHPEEQTVGRALFDQCVQKKSGFQNMERRSLTKQGRLIHIESSGIPVLDDEGQVVGFRGIDRDITRRKRIEKERRELEVRYRQSQKLEALGTLAGGIAHDLNNVMTPIMGGAQLALLKINEGHPFYNNLKIIEEGVQRAADLIHQILAFSRKQVMATRPLNLTLVIEEFAAMLRRLIREDIQLEFDLDEALWTIEADKNQMEQILINLVVNARDAVSSGGKIAIKTANREIPESIGDADDRQIVPGPYVVMSVGDDGHGMDPNTLGRIYDPFFTTKEAGQGTGLGLATVYGIVKQHDGEIQVDTAPGKGTCFNIYFKRSIKSAEKDKQDHPQTVSGGKDTILLVEDDVGVREVASHSLSYYGYRVIEADNGIEAIRVFKELEGRVDLLFTDVVMPAMGGASLAETLREQKPQLPVLFMSGHSFDVNTKELAALQGNAFIQKPFKPLDVARKIRRLLDEVEKGN